MKTKPDSICREILDSRRALIIAGETPAVISLSLLHCRRVWRWLNSMDSGPNPFLPNSFRRFLEKLKARQVLLFGMIVEIRRGLPSPLASVGELSFEI